MGNITGEDSKTTKSHICSLTGVIDLNIKSWMFSNWISILFEYWTTPEVQHGFLQTIVTY